jgi:hypothetical protein
LPQAGSFRPNRDLQRSIGAHSNAMLVCKGSWWRAALTRSHSPQPQKSAGIGYSQMLQLKQSGLDAPADDKGRDILELNQFFELFVVAQAAVELKLLAKIITDIQARTVLVHSIFIWHAPINHLH